MLKKRFQEPPLVSISTATTQVVVGENIEFSISFVDFDANPTTVDVYVEGIPTVFASNVPVVDGKFTVSTTSLTANNQKFYVNTSGVESNRVEITISAKPEEPPASEEPPAPPSTDPSISVSSSKENIISETEIELTVTFGNYETAPTAVSLYVDNLLIGNVTLVNSKYTYDCSQFSNGNHIIYVKKDNVVSNSLLVRKLSTPTDLAVTASSAKNTLKLTWTNNGAPAYWIYMCKNNNSFSAATLLTKEGSSGYEKRLTESGTYYFWIRAANGSGTDSSACNAGNSASYNFTCELELPVPTVTVIEYNAILKNTVFVQMNIPIEGYSLDDLKVHFYCNTTNNPSTATRFATKTRLNTVEYMIKESGTYYFWVKYELINSENHDTSDFSQCTSVPYTFEPWENITDFTASLEDGNNGKKIVLSGNQNGGLVYEVLWGTSSSISNATTLEVESLLDAASFELENTTEHPLVDGTTYYFWIRSVTLDMVTFQIYENTSGQYTGPVSITYHSN